ncbi:MAG TPA: TRAP transporter small permease subunit [Methylomirabilota bacterium]|jgi:TRAP-type mannitol/chloroaromatic compound transport system permease small subunit|nr:TRAP transporter small permease subunit [Methylomirabilota bacterium]
MPPVTSTTTPAHPAESSVRRLARRIDAWQDAFGRALAWLMLVMVLVVFSDVVLRYALNVTSVFTQELEWYLFAITYLLGAGYVMLYDEHVRVDIVYSRLSPRRKAWLNFILLFVFFFPSCFLIIYTTWPFFRNAYRVLEGSPDPGGIPARWALKAVIIVAFAILAIQGFSQAVKNYYVARGWEEPERRVKEGPLE